MARQRFIRIDVHLPDSMDPEPCIVMLGVEEDGQVSLIDSVDVGPFPDWERIARRIMRHLVVDAKRSMA
jgi:hypothetical protein